MPKMKTHSGCAKRFKKNGAGEIKRSQANRRHHSWAKNKKKMRQLKEGVYFDSADAKNMKNLMPY